MASDLLSHGKVLCKTICVTRDIDVPTLILHQARAYSIMVFKVVSWEVLHSAILISDHLTQALQLPLEAAMLANLPRICVHKVLRALHHFDPFLEALWLCGSRRHNSVATHYLPVALRTEVHPFNRTRKLHELDTLSCGTNGFQVSKSLANPVNDTTLFPKGLDVGTAGYEDGVEHGTSHALEVVVWLNTFPNLVLTIRKDGLALGTDDERECLCGFERSHDAVEGDGVVPVCDKNGDTAGSDCRLRGVARRHA